MPEVQKYEARLLLDTRNTLGEGPVWDQREQRLYWVDIEKGILYAYDTINEKTASREFGEMLGAAIPTEQGALLLALESGLAVFDRENDTLIRNRALQNLDSGLRFNDGKCGPKGNLWIGTMHKQLKAGAGNFYRVSPKFKASLQIPGTTISNGMAWSPDQTQFYYIDTEDYYVQGYRYDNQTGLISDKRILFHIPKTFGGPDGMTIDTEGMLWIAHWGGNCVRRWNPQTGEVLAEVRVDAPHVTSCCFGGKELNILYITTARSGLSETQLEQFPHSGGLFCFKSEVRGLRTNFFKDL